MVGVSISQLVVSFNTTFFFFRQCRPRPRSMVLTLPACFIRTPNVELFVSFMACDFCKPQFMYLVCSQRIHV